MVRCTAHRVEGGKELKQILIVTMLLIVLVVSTCGLQATEPVPDLANPASKHCVDQGGKLEIRTEAGGEVGYCLFDDGSECEEWAFFRGDCAPGE
jgi:putative hemolysin